MEQVRERLQSGGCDLETFLRDVGFLDMEVQRYNELVGRAGVSWGGAEHWREVSGDFGGGR